VTASPLVLLDTDILSAIMRRHPQAVARARTYLTEHRRFTFSVITRYEVLRALLAKGAAAQRVPLIGCAPPAKFYQLPSLW
jgi:predicted nucleic acid-binding protein